MTDELKVAVVPGDDAAPEAVHAVMSVLHAMELPIAWEVLPDGVELARDMTRADGEAMVIDAANRSDTVLFGSTSGQTPGVGYFRWGRQTYANVRPIKWRPGFRSPLAAPEGIDYVIVRENLEDLYAGIEGDLREVAESGLADRPRFGGVSRTQLPGGFEHFKDADGRYAIKYFTRANVERVAHFACRLAQRRLEQGYPGKVTCSAKYNVLTKTDGWFVELAGEVAAGYPEIEFETFIADDFARRLVASPHDLDVVLLPNLYGDIFSDEGAGTIGGLGLAPSGCFGDDWAYFESVHGTAPDIAGQHRINPTATMLSAAMMLDYLGLQRAGRAARAGDRGDLRRRRTPDRRPGRQRQHGGLRRGGHRRSGLMAGAHGSRTHPRRCGPPRNGVEDRGGHRAPSAPP